MAKILVIYDSNSGNTEKMALAVAKGAKEEGTLEVTVKKAAETKPSDLLAANGIIIWGLLHISGKCQLNLKHSLIKSEQVHKQLGGKVGGAFTSSGGTASGAETTLLSIVHAMLIHGMIVQGRADDAHYGVAVMGAPSKEDLAECEMLGRNVTVLVKKLNSC